MKPYITLLDMVTSEGSLMGKLSSDWEDCIDLMVTEYGWDEASTRNLATLYAVDDNFSGFQESIVKIFDLAKKKIQLEDLQLHFLESKIKVGGIVEESFDPDLVCSYDSDRWCTHEKINGVCSWAKEGTQCHCHLFKSLAARIADIKESR